MATIESRNATLLCTSFDRLSDEVNYKMPAPRNIEHKRYGVFHLLTKSDSMLIAYLCAEFKTLNPEHLVALLDLGSVYVNDKRVFEAGLRLKSDDRLRVHTQPRRFDCSELSQKSLLFQDDHWVVVNKPGGVPSHPMVDNYKENLLSWLKSFLKTDLHITNRLDTVTNGLITYAKTKKAQVHYNQLLMSKKIKKEYKAELSGDINEFLLKNDLNKGLWVHYLEPSLTAPKIVKREFDEKFLECKLQILDVLPKDTHSFLVSIQLITGRTHQIRVQMAHEGFPIVGDVLYGAKEHENNKINLSCVRLAWDHFDFRI